MIMFIKKMSSLKESLVICFFNEHDFFYSLENIIPVEYVDDYIKVVDTQLPQHPFITTKLNIFDYDFYRTAFRDYAIAFSWR